MTASFQNLYHSSLTSHSTSPSYVAIYH